MFYELGLWSLGDWSLNPNLISDLLCVTLPLSQCPALQGWG